MSEVLKFPTLPKLKKLGHNLFMLQLSDTPEAQAQADKLVEQLRANNYIVPEHLKGD